MKNNLLIDVVCAIPFEDKRNSFSEVNKTYFVFAEYSEDNTVDLKETVNWVVKMAKEGRLLIKHPERFLPESNSIDKDIFPHITALTKYCRTII